MLITPRWIPALTLSLSLTFLPRIAAASDPVAEVGGRPVSAAELETAAAAELEELERRRHKILENNLGGLIEKRLLELEAERLGMGLEALLAAEVTSKVAPVTDADVDAWYEQNKARVRRPKEAVVGEIRGFLSQQRSQTRRRELLDELRGRFDVTVHLEPLRLAVEVGDAPVKGPRTAPVTVVEFSDFQCPYCRRINPTLDRLRETYGDKVRVAFKQLPLSSIHAQAQKAAEATLCAREQGKFWQMHDALFADQQKLGVDQLKARAAGLGLDSERFDRCLDAGEQRGAVLADAGAARALGLGSTPTILVNGRAVELSGGTSPYDQIAAVIDDELTRIGG